MVKTSRIWTGRRPIKGRDVPVGLLGACFLLASSAVYAKREIRTAFFDAYPTALGTQLDSLPSRSEHCGVCHFRFQGGGQRNPYGIGVEEALAGFPKTGAGMRDAILSIENEDHDGDGFDSLTEITNLARYDNTPTFPGLTAGNLSQASGVQTDDVEPYLVPTGPGPGDSTPPDVVLVSPNGGETLTGNAATTVTWTASDASGIASITLRLSLDDGTTYVPLAIGLPNTGNYTWFVANRPTDRALLRLEAVDNALNSNWDASDAVFSVVAPSGGLVGTTLRDFDMPGTQPLEGGLDMPPPKTCAGCHGNYDSAVEPYANWQGSMMAHASRDPLLEASLAVANQDAPDSGDLCLRCHLYRGWVSGRSVPTDGTLMTPSDEVGVSCVLCHRMVDPIADAANPEIDAGILAALSNPGIDVGNGMLVMDPSDTRRGPFADAVSPHEFVVSPFHREAALCGTCHDVSNPVFEQDGQGGYAPNTMDAPASDFSAENLLPVERTYSEWLHSEYNTPTGVFAPEFAGNKADGRVATCQDCHLRDVAGPGADPTAFPSVPDRVDLPLHDMTGGSTWLPSLLPTLYPSEVDPLAIEAGIDRSIYMLTHAADVAVGLEGDQLRVTVTNKTGHKLPTGYPEGRRIWLNARFYNDALELLGESGAYALDTGVLTRDPQVKVYEVKPGISEPLSGGLGLPSGPSFHFVLNDTVVFDNRIPPRGFVREQFASFGGAPVGHDYADGQYWDETRYNLPAGTTRAEVRLYYQSTTKEFIEFLRDENTTNSKGQQLYDLWSANGKCPPTLMASAIWVPVFEIVEMGFSAVDRFRIGFRSRPGVSYTIEYTDDLSNGPEWRAFQNNGTLVATDTTAQFVDDFTDATSGGPSLSGTRFYRFLYSENP